MSLNDLSQKLFYPVIVNITTAVVLFLLASAFKSEVQALFDAIFSRSTPPVAGYPISCVAEPFDGDPERREMKVDFFIINRTGSSYDAPALDALLAAGNPDPQRPLSSRIVLAIKPPATVEILEKASADFNDGKGQLSVSRDMEQREIEIRIARIGARAVLKVTFLFSDLNFVSAELDRSARSAVPVPDDFIDACYSR